MTLRCSFWFAAILTFTAARQPAVLVLGAVVCLFLYCLEDTSPTVLPATCVAVLRYDVPFTRAATVSHVPRKDTYAYSAAFVSLCCSYVYFPIPTTLLHAWRCCVHFADAFACAACSSATLILPYFAATAAYPSHRLCHFGYRLPFTFLQRLCAYFPFCLPRCVHARLLRRFLPAITIYFCHLLLLRYFDCGRICLPYRYRTYSVATYYSLVLYRVHSEPCHSTYILTLQFCYYCSHCRLLLPYLHLLSPTQRRSDLPASFNLKIVPAC